MESILDAVPVIPQRVWLVIVVVLLVLLLGYTIGARILGFGPHVVKKTETFEYQAGSDAPVKRTESEETQTGRTFWDWMTVVTISAVLAFVAWRYASSQAEQQQYIQGQQARDAALLGYFDAMSELMFDRNLHTSDKGDAVRDIARARTLVALLAVGPERQRDIIRFLYEAELIKPEKPDNRIVNLDRANLTDANLWRMPLNGVDLRGVNLSDGVDANSRGAFLKKADLQRAYLQDTNLKNANLEGANLEGANLSDGMDANSRGALLKKANLQSAKLKGANLKGAKLKGANLKGATMPNGQTYQEWLEDKEGRGEDGENSGLS
jgi:uncharacterized protein YjbI with pentapeptide repeats